MLRETIPPEDVDEIIRGAEAFLQHKAARELEKATLAQLPQAPDGLIRRFTPRYPTRKSREVNPWLPLRELRGNDSTNYYHAYLGEFCRQMISSFHQFEYESGKSNLLPRHVLFIMSDQDCELRRAAYSNPRAEFDLHDVYVAAESSLLPHYQERLFLGAESHPVAWLVNTYLIAKGEYELATIGTALNRLIAQNGEFI